MRTRRVAALVALVSAASSAAASVLTPGNLLVLQVTDPSGTLSTSSVGMTLAEYATTGGAPVQTFAFPTTGSSALSIGGTAVTEGHLSYSDGYIGLGGHATPAGTPNVVTTSTTGDNPVLRRALGFHVAADLAAGPRISATTTSHSGGNIRGSTAVGNDFYTFGGVSNTPLFLPAGSSGIDGIAISSGLNNVRGVNIVNGNTYVAAHPTSRGIYRIEGTPTTTGNAATLFTPTPAADNQGTGQSLGDFWMSPDLSTVYVADDSASAGVPRGGIKKYVKGETGYSFAYQISTDYDGDGAATSGARYFAVDASGPTARLYVTSPDRTRILSLTDMGNAADTAATLTTLLTAEPNTWFRGLVLAPTRVPGDANADGTVDADDFATVDRGFANNSAGWSNGDFNNDGVINDRDYLLIDTTFAVANPLSPEFLSARAGQFGDAYVASLLASVPEPAALTPALIGALGAAARRRRRP
jgi:hypothetical protein